MWRQLKTFFGADKTLFADGGDTVASGDTEVSSFLAREQEFLDLIQAHNGRIRQSDIVATTDWSKSIVSCTLTEMEEQHLVYRVSIGREKVVLIPTVASDLGIDVEA